MLDLDETKAHLRVDLDHEDDLIEGMMAAASASVAEYLNKPLEDLVPCPAPVRAAALLLVADLFKNREAQGPRHLYRNATFENLLAPYKVYA